MLGLSAGTAYVAIKPDLRGIHTDIKRELSSADRDFAKAGDSLRDSLRRGLREGLGDLPSLSEPMKRQGRDAGANFSGAFDREVRTKLAAAQRSLPALKIGVAKTEAEQRIKEIQAQLAALGKKEIGVDIDSGTALSEIKRMHVELAALGAASPDIQVRTDVASAVAQLVAVDRLAEKIDGKDVDIDVKTKGAGAASSFLQQSTLSIGQMAAAAGTLGSALIPVTAAVGGLGLALTAPLAAAGGGATIFGIIAGLAVKKTKDQIKEIGELQDKMSAAKAAIAGTTGASRKSALLEAADATAAYHTALNNLSPAQTRFMHAQELMSGAFATLVQKAGPAIFRPLIQGMRLVTKLMPAVQPILRAVSGAFSSLIGEVGRMASGPGFRSFIDFFAKHAGKAMVSFAHIAMNVGLGIAGLVKAFAPLGTSVLGTIERLSYQMLNLGSSKGTRGFIDYVKKWMPTVIGFFINLWHGGVKLVKALAPIGGVVLKGISALFRVIANIPVDVLTAAIGAIIGGFIALKLAMGAMTLISTGWVGLIVAGVVLVGLAIYTLYKKSATFRKFVHVVWEQIKKDIRIVKAVVTDVLIPALKRLWEGVIKPVFSAIGRAVQATWERVVKPALTALGHFITGTVAPILHRLWTGVVKPVFAAIGRVIAFAWEHVVKPVFRAIQQVLVREVFPILRHLWTDVVKPTFKLIGAAIKVWWAGVRIVFFLLKTYLQQVIFPVFRLLWKVVKPVFSAIGDFIAKTWHKYIKPVFSAIGDFIHDHMVPSFKSGVSAIASAWAGIKAAAAKPVNFVIDTVYNNGLRKFVNSVLDKFPGDAPKLPYVRPLGSGVMHGARERVQFGGPREFARGGVMPGYTPGRDVHRFSSPTGGNLALSGGEAVMVPEFTKAVGVKRVLAWNKLARERGAPALQHEIGGFAAGGIINNLSGRTQMDGEPLSRIHAAQILLAERLSGIAMRVMQGSWQAPSSYSGTSHTGSGVADTSPGSFAAQRALRRVGIAAWARNIPGAHSAGSGAHVHGVSRLDPAARGNSQLAAFASGGDGLGGRDYGPNPPTIPNLFTLLGQFKNLSLSQGSGGGLMSALVSHVTGWIADKGKKLLGNVPGGDTPFGSIAVGAGKSVMDNVASWINAKFGGGGFAGKAVGAAQQYAKGLLSNFGWTAQQFGPLKALWNRESGWRWDADNPSSSAYGIPQALPGSKMATAGADWMTNPATQIRWGLGYIKGRYGSPSGAWAHSQNVGWYDRGGMLKSGHAAVNTSGKPEPVFTHRQWAILKRALNARVMNAGGRISAHWLSDRLDTTAKSATKLRNEFLRARDAMRGFRTRTERAERRLKKLHESERYQDRAADLRRARRAFGRTRSGEAIGADVHETRRDAARALRRARRSPIGRDALADYRKASHALAKLRDEDQVKAAQKRARWRKQEARARLHDERAPIIQARHALKKAQDRHEKADTKEQRQRTRKAIHAARVELRQARQQPDSARKTQARAEIKHANARLDKLGKERREIAKLTKQRDHAGGQQSDAVRDLVRSRKRLENLRDERKERRKARRELRQARNADVLQREEKAQKRLNERIAAEKTARERATKAAAAYKAAQQKALERGRSVRDTGLGLGTIESAAFKTSGGILANLRRSVATVKDWRGIVAKLIAAGLRGPILDEYIDAGPSADAVRLGKSLLAGGQIGEIVALQAQLRGESIAAGATVAGAIMPKSAAVKPKPKPKPHKPKPHVVKHRPKPPRGAIRASAIAEPGQRGSIGRQYVIQYSGMPADTAESIVQKTTQRVKYEINREAML